MNIKFSLLLCVTFLAWGIWGIVYGSILSIVVFPIAGLIYIIGAYFWDWFEESYIPLPTKEYEFKKGDKVHFLDGKHSYSGEIVFSFERNNSRSHDIKEEKTGKIFRISSKNIIG